MFTLNAVYLISVSITDIINIVYGSRSSKVAVYVVDIIFEYVFETKA